MQTHSRADAAAAGRVWLDVPYSDRLRAKVAGALWDPVRRSWYAPRAGVRALQQWARLPDVLPGEDRSYGEGLFVDLIPSTSWFVNVRSAVIRRDWDRLRTMVYRRAGHRCEGCGSRPNPAHGLLLEAHERFTYDPRSGVQRLVRLICLCTACHGVTHFGFTALGGAGEAEAALGHLQLVTGMTRDQAERHVRAAFALWERRSAVRWQLDLSVIKNAGIATQRGHGR